jgi:hypothetical protein
VLPGVNNVLTHAREEHVNKRASLRDGASKCLVPPTFDSDELDHSDTEPEAFVCMGLKLHIFYNASLVM